ncbi:hypothetical protein WJX73_002480 [Symbiochloris irregularis]|uniref:Uncharacterized protein n=1 Tax=Symbiochloris irregularis TaxID=706552 RepID=A0AAW1NRU5_9CHLO
MRVLSRIALQASRLALPAVTSGANACAFSPSTSQAGPSLSNFRRLHFTHHLESAEAAPAPATPIISSLEDEDEDMADLTPVEVVERLDRFIVGQTEAKRAVANALRNRWRRHRIASPMKEEIVPKNILMIGPTGCGKTEIARRLARLADAPFIKVEATKFTEVGFHGRDVDAIIRDLLDNAIAMMRQRQKRKLQKEINACVERRILEALCGEAASENSIESFRALLRQGELEKRPIKIDASPARHPVNSVENFSGFHEVIVKWDKVMANQRHGNAEKREMTIAEARPVIEAQEEERLVSNDAVLRDAVTAVEQDGIVFLDEIDKIVTNQDTRYGADASSEGVQRDLLPIIEGSVVSTKYGNVKTDHILFICSGAFHSCKPSDMLAELQGRLPIRVELKGLTAADFYRILTEPEHNMLKQQAALLATEGVDLLFTDEAVREVARVAEEVNTSVDNIGARRLHTVLERLIDDISFHAPEKAAQDGGKTKVIIERRDVTDRVGELLKKQDLSKYVL